MIPVLIIWLLRRYKQRRQPIQRIKTHIQNFKRQLPPVAGLLLLAILLLITVKSRSQNRQFNYQIVRNGNKVGTLSFSETTNGIMDYLKMESDVRTRFIFTFTAHASEDAVYRNGVLQQSSIFRQLNGNVKVNKQHLAQNSQYVIRAGNWQESLKVVRIDFVDILRLFNEPKSEFLFSLIDFKS